jgi:hypothetical protein
MTTIDAVNAILRTYGRELTTKPAPKAATKPAKKTGKLSGKPVFVKLTKPVKKASNNTVTIRKSFRQLLK